MIKLNPKITIGIHDQYRDYYHNGPDFSSCPPDECINPAHPVTREQGVLYRRECLYFLTADRRIQRTTFSDGTTVTVNLDTDEIKVSSPRYVRKRLKGKCVMFLAENLSFEQSASIAFD